MPAVVERIQVRRLSGSLGAEILGVKLCDLDAEGFAVVHRFDAAAVPAPGFDRAAA